MPSYVHLPFVECWCTQAFMFDASLGAVMQLLEYPLTFPDC